MNSTLLSRIRGRVRAEDGERGIAIAVVLMAILIVTSLSVLTLGFVLAQVKPTVTAANRVQALQTAEGGLQTMVNLIRTASDGTKTDWDLLPCQTVTGEASTQRDLHYKVSVTYYDTDPSGLTRATLNSHKVRCHSNLTEYALIVSQALDAGGGVVKVDEGNRSLQQVYELRATNALFGSGGLIRADSDSSVCITTTYADVGERIHLTKCAYADPAAAGVRNWTYRTDYRVLATNSVKTGAALCWTVNSVAIGQTIYLGTCGKHPYQQWGYDDAPQYFISSGGKKYCISAPGVKQNDGDSLSLQACSSSYTPASYGLYWRPDNGVGAGHALTIDDNINGKSIQWVNYGRYGQCIDFASFGQIASGKINEYMVYPCKNDPTPKAIGWNQVLRYDPNTKQMKVRAGNYAEPFDDAEDRGAPLECLTTAGQHAQMGLADCDSSDSRQKWKVYRLVRGDIKLSYTIRQIDSDTSTANDKCLDVGPAKDYVFGSYGFYALTLHACDGSNEQKWNAPPIITDGGVADLQEDDAS